MVCRTGNPFIHRAAAEVYRVCDLLLHRHYSRSSHFVVVRLATVSRTGLSGGRGVLYYYYYYK